MRRYGQVVKVARVQLKSFVHLILLIEMFFGVNVKKRKLMLMTYQTLRSCYEDFN